MIFPVIFWLSAPGMAEAADYREELQWSQMETDLLEGNSVEWHLDDGMDHEAQPKGVVC